MDNLQDILCGIETKVRNLALEKVNLEACVLQQQEQILSLQKEIERLKANSIKQQKETKEEENINKISNIINNSSDIAECRNIINDLLRKINKSIAIVEAKENTDNVQSL